MKGTIVTLQTPSVSEILSKAGYDWLMIDMEHSSLSLSDTQAHLQAMDKDCFSVVRIPVNEDVWIKRILDLGCSGIMIPMVCTAEEARKAVLSAKYPPVGRRSVGIGRAHGYGLGFEDYLEKANQEVKILIQIEHIQGVENLEEILQVEGIDALFIGPYDLSASMGLAGQTGHPEVVAAIQKVKAACESQQIPWGIFSTDADSLQKEKAAGGKWLLHSIDILHLAAWAKHSLKTLGE